MKITFFYDMKSALAPARTLSFSSYAKPKAARTAERKSVPPTLKM